MDQAQKEIIKKIQKLLRLAEKAGSEEEAQTAMKMVREILGKYNLSLKDAESLTEEECNETCLIIKGRYVPAYIKLLLNAMNILFQCKISLMRENDGNINRQKILFIGVGADAIVASQTYQFLINFAFKKAKECKIPQSERKDYYFGFSHAVLERALEIRENIMQNANENALVPCKDAAIKKYVETRYTFEQARRPIRKRNISNGIIAGLNDGREVSLNRQVETSVNLGIE